MQLNFVEQKVITSSSHFFKFLSKSLIHFHTLYIKKKKTLLSRFLRLMCFQSLILHCKNARRAENHASFPPCYTHFTKRNNFFSYTNRVYNSIKASWKIFSKPRTCRWQNRILLISTCSTNEQFFFSVGPPGKTRGFHSWRYLHDYSYPLAGFNDERASLISFYISSFFTE